MRINAMAIDRTVRVNDVRLIPSKEAGGEESEYRQARVAEQDRRFVSQIADTVFELRQAVVIGMPHETIEEGDIADERKLSVLLYPLGHEPALVIGGELYYVLPHALFE